MQRDGERAGLEGTIRSGAQNTLGLPQAGPRGPLEPFQGIITSGGANGGGASSRAARVRAPTMLLLAPTLCCALALGGRLLREALSIRGRSLTAYDECHTVDDMSMAGYAETLKSVGVVVDGIDAAGRWMRMPRIALTSTLPPVVRQRVMRRLRLAPDAHLVRNSIDRQDITYFRVPLKRVDGESVVAGGLRALRIARPTAWCTVVYADL